MQREFTLCGKVVSYTLKLSSRARKVSATVYPNGALVVSVPKHLTESAAQRFLREKQNWVLKNLAKAESSPVIVLPNHKGRQYALLRRSAELFIERAILQFNVLYHFSYNTVRVRNVRRQWGSCSAKKNLSFSYKLILLPEELAHYIVVHELCHLKEMNHSHAFWHLVERAFPHYRRLEKELRSYQLSL